MTIPSAWLLGKFARSPLFKTTINLTLAIRKALRRYLGIEPAAIQIAEKSDK